MKTMRLIGMAILAVIMSVNFAACGGDDDDNDSPSGNNGTITTDDGDKILLSSITENGHSGISITYNDEGQPTYANCWGMIYNISYNPYQITCEEDYDNLSLSFNSDGYVTKMTWGREWIGNYTSDVYSGSMSCSYDSDGHLTKVSCSENETEDDYGDTYTYSSSLTATLTWSKGNLTKVVIKEDGTDDGDKYSSTDTYVYEYGNEVNEYKQPLMALSEVYENFGDYSDLMFIGYFGIGTSYLPTSVEERYVYSDDEEDEDETWSWEASYTTNSNGTIKTEKFVDTYTYAYYTLSTRSATPSEQVYNSSEETSRHINPLKHHHGHHMHE